MRQPPDAPRTSRADPSRADATLRTRHSEVMLAFSVVALVMAHRYQPRFLFFPVHAFYVALVFFVAGHAANVPANAHGRLRSIAGVLRAGLGRFYLYNLVFATAVGVLGAAGLQMAGAVPSFSSTDAVLGSLKDFLFGAFAGGAQYELFHPGWILVQLVVVQVLFKAVCPSPSRLYVGAVLAVAAVFAAVQLDGALGGTAGMKLFTVRTAFAFVFFLFGYLIKALGPELRAALTAPSIVVWGFLAVDFLTANFGNTAYAIDRGNIANANVVVPLLSTAAILVMVHQLAYYVARIVGERSVLLSIGRSALHILVWHSAVFFLVNCCFYAFGALTSEELAKVDAAYALNKTWLLYVVPAIALPVAFRHAAQRLLKRALPNLV